MANEFSNGVSFFTEGLASVPVYFPENRVACHYCPFCRAESDLNRFWYRLTNNMIYNPNVPELPEFCPIELMGEIRGTHPKHKKGD
jgi:hypothetical protein